MSLLSRPSTRFEGEDVYQYAERMFRNRGKGIGQAGKDNGLLVLAAVKDRQLKVEVGYDLEQFITDGFAGETIRQEIAPRFRQGGTALGWLRACSASSDASAKGATSRFPARRVRLIGVAHRWRLRWKRLHSDDRPFVLINGIAGRLGRRRGRRWGGGGWSGWNSGVGPFGGGFGGRGGDSAVDGVWRGRRRIWWIWRRPQWRRRRRRSWCRCLVSVVGG